MASNNNKSYIYGIDGGVRFCGYSIFDSETKELITAGRVCTAKPLDSNLSTRLWKIGDKFRSLFDKYPPVAIAIEKPRMAITFQGRCVEPYHLFKIHWVYGVVFGQLAKEQAANCEIFPYNLTTVFCKVLNTHSVRRNRTQKKALINNYITSVIEEDYPHACIKSKTQDTYDAIMIGLYHIRFA